MKKTNRICYDEQYCEQYGDHCEECNMSDLNEAEDLPEMQDYLEAIPNIPKDEIGKIHKALCPCGGTLTAVRVNNGHLHVSCDKCGFTLME